MGATHSGEIDVDRLTGIPGFQRPVRRAPRRVVAWAARIRTNGGDYLPCRVVDISEHGAGVSVYDAPDSSLAVGDTIDLEMLGAEMNWQRCDAQVRHVTPIAQGVRVGVEFASALT